MLLYQDGFDHYGDATDEGQTATHARMLQAFWAELSTNADVIYTDDANPSPPSVARTGPGMLRIESRSGSGFGGARLVLDDTQTDLFVYQAMFASALPASSNTYSALELCDGSNNVIGRIYLQPNGALRYVIGNVDATTGANVITPGTWHAVCLHVTISDTTGVVQLYVDRELIVDLSGQNTGTTAIGMLRWSVASAGSDAATMYFDDLLIHNASGSYNTAFVGDPRIHTTFARADDETGWTPNTRHIFGNGVGQLDGNGDAFTCSDSAQVELGTGDYTIETFVRFNSLPTGSNKATFVAKWREGTNERSFRLFLGGPSLNSNRMQLDVSTDGTAGTVATITSAEWLPELGRLYHVCVQRDGGETVIFVDGVPLNAPAADANNYHDNTALLSIGGEQTGASSILANTSINGWIDEFRYTVGIARYNPTGFVAPSAAFGRSVGTDPDFASVALLMGFDNAVQDDSSFGRAVTSRGNAARYAPDDAQPGDYKTVNSLTPRDDTYMAAAFVAASNVLTFTGQPSNGDTIEVDSVTYTFNTVLGGAGSVLIGGSVSASIDNLVAAINGGAGEGTNYGTGTTASDEANALNIGNSQMTVTANTPGTAGNTITADESCANADWADTGGTLVGGLDIPGPSSFFMTRLPAETTGVIGLMLVGRARKTNSGTAKLQMSFVTADDSSANGDEHTLTTSVTHYKDIIEEDPSTTAGLTPASFVGSRVRIDRTE